MLEVKNVNSLKEFDQEDIHRFMSYCGKELYDKHSGSDLPENVSFYNQVKRGILRPLEINKALSRENIIFPANNRIYYSKDYIQLIKEGSEKLDPSFDIPIYVNNGFLEFDDGNIYAAMWNILPKYHTENSSWHYKMVKIGNNNPKPIITVPTSSDGWSEIIKALTEFTVFLKVFLGCIFKTYIIKTDYTPGYQKSFSFKPGTMCEEPLSYIPTIINLGYRYVGYPKIMGKISTEINKYCKQDVNPRTRDNLIRYGKHNFKDLYLVNLGTGSCYINPAYIKDIEQLRKVADSSRLRTMMDWILKGYEDHKHCIFYSDLDNSIAIAHEMGHYLEDKDGTLGMIQRNNKKGILSEDSIESIGYIAGFTGSFFGNSVAAITEIGSTLGGILLSTPLLFSEYMASYKGLKILEKIGCSDEELKIARDYYKAAFKSYLLYTPTVGATASVGRLVGNSAQFLNSKFRRK